MNTSRVFNVAVVGPVGAGKYSAIESVSNEETGSSTNQPGVNENDKVPRKIPGVTKGSFRSNESLTVHLIGTSTLDCAEFTAEFISGELTGMIVLLDSSREAIADDLTFYLDQFSEFGLKQKFVIGVTKMSHQPNRGLKSYRKILDTLNVHAPLLEVDARSARDVKLLVHALLACIEVS